MQELDLRLDQLRHQRDTLPEIARLKELEGRHKDLLDRLRDVQIGVDDLTREQKRADADVEQVKARRTRDRDRIDKGLVSNPKDLERMQHEMESLERRISVLEDAELEVMEQLETATADLDEAKGAVAEIEASVATLRASRDEKAADVDARLVEVARERDQAVQGMPEDLMALYERLRAQKGGTGAAALRARQCGGCRLTLNAADLGVIAKAPVDEVLRCEECDRILVRTSESGI